MAYINLLYMHSYIQLMISLPLCCYVIALNNGNICIGYSECECIRIDNYKFLHELKCNSLRHTLPPPHSSHFYRFCCYFADPQ